MERKKVPFLFRKRRLSLSLYLSLLLALAAIIPIYIILGSIEIFLQPSIISQIDVSMKRDAQTRIQLVDTYLSERLNDVKTLSETTAVKTLLSGEQKNSDTAQNIFITTQHRDVANYISLSLLDTQSKVILSYPAPPVAHGKYLILPEAQQQLQQSGKVYISNVFYNPTEKVASVDLYSQVIDNNFRILGYIRASLGLRRIWAAVDGEPQASGAGSYATLLDQNGIRIAYTNPDLSGFTHSPFLFQAIAPISPELQTRIQDEGLYGNDSRRVTSHVDLALANFQNNKQGTNTTFTPNGQQQAYEAAKYESSVVPWTYVIFKPFNNVSDLADQQLLSTFVIIAIMLILSVIVGLTVGHSLTLPILRSVSLLRKSHIALKTLADEENAIAAEQSWMIEGSQSALKSVQYYTNATSLAAKRINILSQGIYAMDQNTLHKSLQEMAEAASYIENAIKHQETMNEKLATSLRVTTQATEQLTRGASSTNEAATQMEYIIQQLTSVVRQ